MTNIARFYYELPKARKPRFRVLVSDACGWSYGTFYYKLKNGNISKLENLVISEIMCSLSPQIN